MSKQETYVKLFRRMLNWGWYGDTNTFRVFMHILLKAQHKPTEYKGKIINAGECVFGRKAWAKELGLSERQVRTAIKHLKSTNEITVTSTKLFSVIKVENWVLWQIYEGDTDQQSDQRNAQQVTNKRPTSDQQVTTSKESKKEKNVRKKELSYASSWRDYDDDFWNEEVTFYD